MIRWGCKSTFPCRDTLAYRLMALTAICGELPADLLPRLYPRQSYLDKVIRLLLSDKLIRVYYRDKLRGYRLSQKAKDFLLYDNPERFTLYLTGNAETNQLKSELVRRLRLHRLAESYVLMLNSGVTIYRDLKPDVFSPDGCAVRKLTAPCFYTSREIKQMGMETVKISGSRMMGVLLAPTGAYLTYNSGNSFSKWDYRAEQRAKALLKSTICFERLNEQYKPEHLNGLLLGSGLELFNQIMTTADSNARCFFLLDGCYEHFYYLTNDHYGEVLVKLLCAPSKLASLERIISQDLQPKQPGLSIENDAVDMDGNPVLFAYFLDIPRINRFYNGLQLYGRQGTLICFDFQSEASAAAKCRSRPSALTSSKGVFSIRRRNLIKILIVAPIAILAILYAGGYISQFIYNYNTWQANGGAPGDGTAPEAASINFFVCLISAFRIPEGLMGIGACIVLLGVLLIMVMRMGYSETGEYDPDRNFTYSPKGTYGTSGWMDKKEMADVLELTSDLKRCKGVILGRLEGQAVCVPQDTMLNNNIAVYGATGSKKTRAFCMNRILQGVARGESLIISDPKSELYEKSSAYLRNKGYIVKIFNLVQPENSDSWNCLVEIDGQELMAQLFVDVIIKNTSGGKGDHFWDSAEMNLLKALVLYTDRCYPPEHKNMGQVYRLLTLQSENELNSLFDVLPNNHPAKAPYTLFRQASDTVRSGVIIGLGSRLQVFQSELIKKITAADEIDLELPGQIPCAYFLVTSDQDSTFDFLASLFLSFVFIKLVRYADRTCEDGRLPVPVHILGEELTACGTIPDLSRRLSVIRSRNISMSCVFQNLAGLQNRYPYNLWQEIIGNADVQLFLGCTDPLTASFVSERTGLASVAVSSKSKQLGTWRISNYTPEFRETSGVGKRPVLTQDEVMRLPIDDALVIIRGKKPLKVEKFDYSRHPEYSKLHSCKASSYIPEWRRKETECGASVDDAPLPKPPVKKRPPRKKPVKKEVEPAVEPLIPSPPPESEPIYQDTEIISVDKESLMS